MSDASMRMYHVEIEVDRDDGLVALRQPMSFEEEQIIVLSMEQFAAVAKWLEEISKGG